MLHRLLILTFFCFTLLIVIFGNVHESNAQAGTTVTFDDLPPGDSINGEYPAGIINWGTDRWSVNPPFGEFPTNNISFTNFVTTLSFTFVTPRILAQIDAYNDGGADSTVTIACTGNPTIIQVVPIGVLLTIPTGWTTPCTTVTIGSSNRWDTSFDTFVVQSETPTATPTPTTAAGTPTPTPTITPTPIPSWMQVRSGGNVYSRGRITMPIAPPTPSEFNVVGGVATHPDPPDEEGDFRVENGWLLPNYIASTYPYDYDYFHNYLETKMITSLSQIPSPPSGDGVYEITGPLTVSDTTPFDGRNVLLFVNGDLLIESPTFIPVNAATMFIVRGNISFNPAVATARGIFLANGKISTGASNTNTIALTGMVLSYGGINLERNVGQSTPSETIVHDLSLAIALRDELWKSPVAFREAVP